MVFLYRDVYFVVLMWVFSSTYKPTPPAAAPFHYKFFSVTFCVSDAHAHTWVSTAAATDTAWSDSVGGGRTTEREEVVWDRQKSFCVCAGIARWFLLLLYFSPTFSTRHPLYIVVHIYLYYFSNTKFVSKYHTHLVLCHRVKVHVECYTQKYICSTASKIISSKV